MSGELNAGLSVRQAAAVPEWHVIAKRVLDIAVSLAALITLFPLMIIIGLVIKLASSGPVLFRWNVIGRGGHPFVGYKFRTMLRGADRLRERLAEQNEMSGPFFKMKNDPRVFPFGRFLRRFSLDELPQLWSILKGDMSLVGPRPTQVFEYAHLSAYQRARVQVKPGAVSTWIVSGKAADFDTMIEQDLQYVQNWSIWLDLSILLKAIPYIALGKNT